MEYLILPSKLLATESQGFEADLFPWEERKAGRKPCTKWEQTHAGFGKFLGVTRYSRSFSVLSKQ